MSDDHDRLDDVLAAYLEAADGGWAPPRVELLARYPHLRSRLEAFFATGDRVDTLAHSLGAESRSRAGDPTTGGPPAGPAEGLTSFGDYEVLGEVASGGMGIVYRARQTSANRTVALKVILAGAGASAGDVGRFRHEAEAAALMDHPGIVPIYEVGTHQGRPFFTMKLVEGGSLAEHRERFRAPRAAAALVAKVARAVHYAHQRGVLHRDLKPGNVLLGDGDEPLVTDFGLAKRLEGDAGLTQSGAIVGTANYMAPEQASGEARGLTTAADVHALGAILYELLTGTPPFATGNVLDTLLKLRQEKAAPLRGSNAQVDRDLETICLKCLEKEPGRRYGSAAALADDLERWQRGEPIEARPAGRWERLRRWVKRNPAVAGLVVALALTLVAGSAVSSGLAVWATGEATRADREAERALRQAGRADTERDAARQHAFRADSLSHALLLDKAARALVESRDEMQARELLARCPPGMENTWEHRHVQGLHRRLAPRTLKGHLAPIHSVAYSPDGLHLATGGQEPRAGEVKVWDARTGEEKLTLKGHTSGVFSVAFSPDGRRLASASGDMTVKVWGAGSGREQLSLRGHGGIVHSVAFSPDGSAIASASWDKTVKIWDARTGVVKLTLRGHTKWVKSVAFSPDGLQLASASNDHTVRLWDVRTGQEKLSLRGHTNWVHSVAYSPDGTRLASASWDKTIKVWDSASGRELLSLQGHTDIVLGVAFSPDGRRLASASQDQAVRVWDARTGREKFVLMGHANLIPSVAFSPDGRGIASGSYDKTVKLWDAGGGQEALTLRGHEDAVSCVAYSPDGERLASGSWDKTVRLWDARTGEELRSLSGHAERVQGVAYSPDGRRVASASKDRTVKVWDVRSGVTLRTLKGHTHWVDSVAFSPDGERLASGSWDKTVRLWDARTGEELRSLNGHTRHVTGVAYSPDGRRVASAGGDGTVRVWDARTGEALMTFRGIGCVAFSPDGRRLVSGGVDNKSVKVWSEDIEMEKLSLRGHDSFVRSVAFSFDGRRIASGGLDRTVRIWYSP